MDDWWVEYLSKVPAALLQRAKTVADLRSLTVIGGNKVIMVGRLDKSLIEGTSMGVMVRMYLHDANDEPFEMVFARQLWSAAGTGWKWVSRWPCRGVCCAARRRIGLRCWRTSLYWS